MLFRTRNSSDKSGRNSSPCRDLAHGHGPCLASLMTQDSSTFWKKSRVELRAAGFDPDRSARTNAVVTIASAYTNAHRCNNRVRSITDLLVDLLAERGGQGLIVGAPAVSDALTQGTPTAGYSLVSRDVVADCFE